MAVRLDPFYLIVENAAWIKRLVPLGVKLVQLRIKGQSADIIERDIRLSQTVCNAYGCQLIINDYWQAALDIGCDFVHLGQEDLENADIPALRQAGVRLGISTHDAAELEHALKLEPDYVALGPVYPTILKKMSWAPQGLDRVGEWKCRIGDIPLVAIGGLNIERLPDVFAAGADSAGVVTDIIRAPDPAIRTREWITATEAQVDIGYRKKL